MFTEILYALIETCQMVFVSGAIACIVGLPLGVILFATSKNQFWQHKPINVILSLLVNVGRSIPFIILFIALMPFTKFLLHKTIGVWPAILVLSVAAIPFYARLVELALNEISPGLIEASHAMGASHLQLIRHILIPEAKAPLISGGTLTLVNLVGYSAMAGFTGTGGLGAMAINYGYNRYDTQIILITVLLMIFLVQLIQFIGDYAVRKIYTI